MPKFKTVKEKLIKNCQKFFPDFSHDPEFEAAITHWLLSPNILPPKMPKNVFKECKKYFDFKIQEKKHPQALQQEQAVFQAAFKFVMDDIPFPPPKQPKFTFIDLFAGIGGFRIAFQKLGGHCVFSCEWDKYAKQTYEFNFGEVPYGDINQFASADMTDEAVSELIPKHDVLCAGFPCQPFSLAGVSKKQSMGREHGFEDKTQGTLFFNIAKIIAARQPKVFFLENVKNLLSHDKGKTWQIIEDALKELGYVFTKKVVDGSKWVPQHRERVFIIGYNPKLNIQQRDIVIPEKPSNDYVYPELKDIILSKVPDEYTLGPGTWDTLERHKANHAAKGNGFGYGLHTMPIKVGETTRTISARYHKDGAEILIEQKGKLPRKLTVEEAQQLQGLPKNFKFPVSNTQAYRQIGNGVVVPAVYETAKEIVKSILKQS